MKNIVVIGGGGHAKVVIDIIEKENRFNLVGVVDAQPTAGTKILGQPVLGRDEDLPKLMHEYHLHGCVLGIGDNWTRSKVATAIQSRVPEMEFPNAVHPAAHIAKGVRFGQGSVIMAGAVVNSSAVLGDFCVVNTNSSLDHDAQLGDFASLAPNACAGGLVDIGEYCAICLGANVIHNVKIGAHTIVGAGATVLKDLPSRVLAVGTPARVVREREPDERYL